MFPKYYDPVYRPCCRPEVFKTRTAVKKWIVPIKKIAIDVFP